jgi:hypothetical protein
LKPFPEAHIRTYAVRAHNVTIDGDDDAAVDGVNVMILDLAQHRDTFLRVRTHSLQGKLMNSGWPFHHPHLWPVFGRANLIQPVFGRADQKDNL